MITNNQLAQILKFIHPIPDQVRSCAEVNFDLWRVWCEIKGRPCDYGAPWWTESLVNYDINEMLERLENDA